MKFHSAWAGVPTLLAILFAATIPLFTPTLAQAEEPSEGEPVLMWKRRSKCFTAPNCHCDTQTNWRCRQWTVNGSWVCESTSQGSNVNCP